jgi:hypothetical protein
MAGHSQFKNIMYRKGAQDKKRAKVFTKIIRELVTAARSGLPDPAANPRLRAAILAARQANMPRDTVERAIRRGSGGEAGEAYDEVRYEGYGPGGVAVIIEALTDNRNRTASEVRAALPPAARSADQQRQLHVRACRRVSYPAAAASADGHVRSGHRGRRGKRRARPGSVVTCAPEDLNAVRRAGRPVWAGGLGAPRVAPEDYRAVDERPRRPCSSCSRRSRTATTSRTSTPISKWPKT